MSYSGCEKKHNKHICYYVSEYKAGDFIDPSVEYLIGFLEPGVKMMFHNKEYEAKGYVQVRIPEPISLHPRFTDHQDKANESNESDEANEAKANNVIIQPQESMDLWMCGDLTPICTCTSTFSYTQVTLNKDCKALTVSCSDKARELIYKKSFRGTSDHIIEWNPDKKDYTLNGTLMVADFLHVEYFQKEKDYWRKTNNLITDEDAQCMTDRQMRQECLKLQFKYDHQTDPVIKSSIYQGLFAYGKPIKYSLLSNCDMKFLDEFHVPFQPNLICTSLVNFQCILLQHGLAPCHPGLWKDYDGIREDIQKYCHARNQLKY